MDGDSSQIWATSMEKGQIWDGESGRTGMNLGEQGYAGDARSEPERATMADGRRWPTWTSDLDGDSQEGQRWPIP
ncbi:unnamed protein product [Cuscuta campestris]|uniref:Uncharacterized protein n=1 Tax=Cuscuta campestris TaxID=132261 RepID=A0A484KUN3_9ASTE|nr:unnamed protein product [Cuscuta campestris]